MLSVPVGICLFRISFYWYTNHVVCQGAWLRHAAPRAHSRKGGTPPGPSVCAGPGTRVRGFTSTRVGRRSIACDEQRRRCRDLVSQQTHRDRLAYSHGVPIGDEVSPLTIDTSLPECVYGDSRDTTMGIVGRPATLMPLPSILPSPSDAVRCEHILHICGTCK